MIQLLKNIAKKTFLYGMVQRSRVRNTVKTWTPHDDEMVAFYSQFVPAGKTCFDIGANVGNRVKVFLKLGAKVVAVEPQRECQRILNSIFAGQPNFSLVPKAMGAAEGEAEIVIADVSTVSSMSQEWIEKVQSSGRFGGMKWTRKRTVPVTTLDKLIAQFGAPAFIKIDVEGYEYQVIQGLSQPVRSLSLEFTPEFLDSTLRCIEHLARLGDIRLNYSLGESMKLASADWHTIPEMTKILDGFRGDNELVGDLYVRFTAGT